MPDPVCGAQVDPTDARHVHRALQYLRRAPLTATPRVEILSTVGPDGSTKDPQHPPPCKSLSTTQLCKALQRLQKSFPANISSHVEACPIQHEESHDRGNLPKVHADQIIQSAISLCAGIFTWRSSADKRSRSQVTTRHPSPNQLSTAQIVEMHKNSSDEPKTAE